MVMKKNEISPRDQEMLSAYLDGQLSSKDIAGLQKRLQDDQQMQIALDELRLTRIALRSLPMLRAPRNFTLTPQMVGKHAPARRPTYPAFGFASLAAAMLLVLVFVADRMSFVNTSQLAALDSAAQSTQMEQLVETMVVESLATQGAAVPQAEAMQLKEAPMAAEESADSARTMEVTPEENAVTLMLPEPITTTELFAETYTATTEMAEEAPSASDMQSAAGASPEITPTMTATPTPWLVNGTEVLGVGGGAPDTPRQAHTATPEPSGTPALSPTPSSTCTLEPTPSPTDTPLPSDTPVPTETPVPAGELLQMQPSASETPAPQVSQDQQPQIPQPDQATPEPGRILSRPVILAVEIVLGLLAVGCAAIFIYLYRKAG